MKKYFSSFNSLKSLFNPLNSLCPSIIGVAVLLPLVACLASCRNELLEPPDFSDRGGTYSSTDISAPKGVSATQGGFRSITVSWKPVENAVKYEVYTTKIATTVFEKRTETNGNDKTSVKIMEDADVIVYFKVKAYDKNGNASEFSKMCHGTTLGAPIITNIIQDELGKSATVRWWCGTYFTASTYKNEVKYSIALYEDAEGTTKIAEQEMDGSAIKMTDDVSDGEISAECTFTGLSPKTTYYYQVKAYLKDSPGEVEASAIVDKETARRLIPNPVEGLEATQGISDKQVTLSFTLPDFVDVKESNDIFLKKPLYFEISRAEIEYTASEEIDEETGRTIYTEGKKPTTDYTVIATIRAASSSEWSAESGSTYYFDCTNNGDNTSNKKLTLEKTDGVESNEGDTEPYIPGYKMTFTDTTAQRGDDKPPVYSYKITSYADVAKKITSDESIAKATGWLIGNLKLDLSAKKIDYEYADAEESQISKITVKLSCTFEDYGKDYTYIVTQSAIDTKDTPIVDETIIKNMDIKELKDFSIEYDLSKDKEGYYSYKFYIAPKGTETLSNAYYCYDKYRTETLVVKDKPLEIKRFEVEDGYSDKFVIKWSYNPEFTYKLSWTPVVNGDDQEQESMAFGASLENNDGNVGVITSVDSDGMAIFEHAATSGDIRKYSIKITSRLSLPKDFEHSSYTLGTALAKQVGYAYDTITVEWDKVQMAESYTLDAWYEEDVGALPINIDNIIGETSYTFTPDKYNDATIAGKEMKVRITAKNAKASTESEVIPARLIGPADVEATVNTFDEATEDSISVSWNEVEGANGYLIRRVMYSDTAAKNVVTNSDVTYYYDALKNTVVSDREKDLSGRVDVSKEGNIIKLVDNDKEADGDPTEVNMDYREAQSKISWGLPFRYVVLPVLEENDFKFEDKTLALESGKVKYENFAKTETDTTATFGYGMNLVAEKAMSSTTQKIQWEKPNTLEKVQKAIYRRKFTTDETAKFTYLNIKSNDVDATIPIEGEDLYDAFEYVVKYYKEGVTPKPSIDSLPKSLLDKLKQQTEKAQLTPYGEKIEQKNKGYLLSVKLEAVPHPNPNKEAKYTYAEQISWTSWDYDIRAVGPKTMMLTIKNNNIDAKDHEILSITVDKTTGKQTADLKTIDTDTIIEQDTTTMFSIMSNELMSNELVTGKGTANGMLKVLRDYKHYYTLTLTSETGTEVTYEKDTYRNITDEELVKATMLILAAIEHDSDSQSHDSGGKFNLDGNRGSFSGSGSVSSELTWHLNTYKHNWKKLPSGDTNFPAFLTLDDKEGTKGRKYGKYFVHLSTDSGKSFKIDKPISISVSSEVYGTKTITVASSKDEFKAIVNSNTYSEDGLENCRYWMPMEWYKEGDAVGWINTQKGYGYFGESSQYGWWPPSN